MPDNEHESFIWDEFGGAASKLARGILDGGFQPDVVASIGADAHSVCLYSNPGTVAEPDFRWRSTKRWIDLPWSVVPPVAA